MVFQKGRVLAQDGVNDRICAKRGFDGPPAEVNATTIRNPRGGLDGTRTYLLRQPHDSRPPSRSRHSTLGPLAENPEFVRFAHHWQFRARACRPYRAKTKGKVERGPPRTARCRSGGPQSFAIGLSCPLVFFSRTGALQRLQPLVFLSQSSRLPTAAPSLPWFKLTLLIERRRASHATALKRSKRSASRSRSGRSLTRLGR